MSSLGAYFFAARTVRNWFPLIQNLRHGGYRSGGPVLERLVLWNGQTIVHPPHRGGLAAMLLEVWHQNVYRLGQFYRPKVNDVVVDIGAHIGLFTLRLIREQPACNIIAFEPSPENFLCLRSNLAPLAHRKIQAYNLAIAGDFERVMMTEIPTNRSFDARTMPAACDDDSAISAVPLSYAFELADADEIALLKMDAEGGEYGAFSTADRKVLVRIQRLAMEYHDHLVPGTLALVRQRLSATHQLEVLPEPGAAHGRLFAVRKDLVKKASVLPSSSSLAQSTCATT